MALYTNESKDRVRDAVDFVELVSARTELRRAGPARFEGLCPFHDERTPSFGIDPGQKVYHCFGCQASGDVFTFVQETEGVDFKGALELLAERYGVELQREQEDPREAERRKQRERLLELLSRTATYYERYLWESSEATAAREYLAGRGLSEEMLREFRVGYAPSAWDRVLLASRRGGFSVAELYATGLAQRSKQNGQPYDRFRSRIMFPLTDIRGRVLGFGARAMREDQRPKYLNTSDNDVYHKGLHLYGADLARAHAARAGTVILCEGYTDAIALHQAGMRNAVGLMGTALTGDQVGELSRMAQTVLLALDADSAGQEAMLRASGLAAKRKLELRVVPLPAGADPADLIQGEGPEAMAALVERSVPFVRFRVERVLASGDDSSPEGRDRMVEELRPVFAQLAPGAMRDELVRMVSGRLAVPASVFEQRLAARRIECACKCRRAGACGRADAVSSRVAGDRRAKHARPVTRCMGAKTPSGRFWRCASQLRRRASRRWRAWTSTSTSPASCCAARPGICAQAICTLRWRPGRKGRRWRATRSSRRCWRSWSWRAGATAANPAMLEAQRLQLELARVDRQIQRARGAQSGEISDLARRKATVKRDFDRAYARVLEETGDRE